MSAPGGTFEFLIDGPSIRLMYTPVNGKPLYADAKWGPGLAQLCSNSHRDGMRSACLRFSSCNDQSQELYELKEEVARLNETIERMIEMGLERG